MDWTPTATELPCGECRGTGENQRDGGVGANCSSCSGTGSVLADGIWVRIPDEPKTLAAMRAVGIVK